MHAIFELGVNVLFANALENFLNDGRSGRHIE